MDDSELAAEELDTLEVDAALEADVALEVVVALEELDEATLDALLLELPPVEVALLVVLVTLSLVVLEKPVELPAAVVARELEESSLLVVSGC